MTQSAGGIKPARRLKALQSAADRGSFGQVRRARLVGAVP